MPLRIGTRGSRLALAQAAEVAEMLGGETELVPIVTSGDRGASAEGVAGGVKGLFVAEITEALARGEVDLAVHSAKDLPSEDPEGVVVAAVPQRALPYDVLIGADPGPGVRFGTSSLRRQAQLLRDHPDLEVVDLRGNVDTRLRRLEEGRCDGLVLAAAGLARLGLEPPGARPIPLDVMVPAPGQGALAVQAVEGSAAAEAAAAIDHPRSRAAFEAERDLVRLLGGGCRLPLGAYAEWRDEAVRLMAIVIRPDGSDPLMAQVEAPDPAVAAAEAAEILRRGGAEDILREAEG
ncbi:MAG TPA: hydroxymethylbilane synthase [Actinomycetota bacterium]|nr:hydroxymethylbilane synthase [Actinomycetota bacterium]